MKKGACGEEAEARREEKQREREETKYPRNLEKEIAGERKE